MHQVPCHAHYHTPNSAPKWLQSPFCCLAHTAHITLNNTVSNHYKDHHNHSHTWHDTVNNQLNKDHHNHSLLLLLFCILWWNWEVFCHLKYNCDVSSHKKFNKLTLEDCFSGPVSSQKLVTRRSLQFNALSSSAQLSSSRGLLIPT